MSDDHAVQDAISETDYRLILDAILDAEIIQLDRNGAVRTWNEGAKAITRFSADEVIGKNVSMFYAQEDLDSDLVGRELGRAAESGRYEGECWQKKRDGSLFWANVTIQPMHSEDGELAGFVKVVRDFTAMRTQQDALRRASLMLDSIGDYEVIFLDTRGVIQTWNTGARNVKGYTANEAIGQNISMFYLPEDASSGQADRELSDALQNGRFETDGIRLRKGGIQFLANVTISPVRDRDGEHIGFVKVTRDVTERVERERLVQRQKDEILELSTPVIQIWDRVLALPIIGTLDSGRASRLTESLLQRIASDEAAVVILDISGVPMIDTAVAQHLFKTIQGARLMGAESVISGVRPETAQAMVHLGIDIGRIHSRPTLRDALQLAFRILTERVRDHDADQSTSSAPLEHVLDLATAEQATAVR